MQQVETSVLFNKASVNFGYIKLCFVVVELVKY